MEHSPRVGARDVERRDNAYVTPVESMNFRTAHAFTGGAPDAPRGDTDQHDGDDSDSDARCKRCKRPVRRGPPPRRRQVLHANFTGPEDAFSAPALPSAAGGESMSSLHVPAARGIARAGLLLIATATLLAPAHADAARRRFRRMVVVGDSVLAGFGSGGLIGSGTTGQRDSAPALV